MERTMKDVVLAKVQHAVEQGGSTAAEAWDKLKQQGNIMQDFLVPIGKDGRCHFDHSGHTLEDLRLVMTNENGEEVGTWKSFHRNGIEQLAQRLTIPPVWLRDMVFTGDTWRKRASCRLLNSHAVNLDTTTVLVRCVGDEVRAVLSDRYRRMDTVPVYGSFLSQGFAQGAKLYSGAVTDLKSHLEVLLPEVVEVDMPNGDPVHIVFGANITTSDFGKGSLEVRGFYLQGACLNGMIRKNVLRQVHLGAKMEYGDIMSLETLQKETEAMRSAVGDIVRHVLSETYRTQTVAIIQAAGGKVVDVQKEVKLLQNWGLLKSEVDEVDALIINNHPDDGVSGGPTAWKVVQGITAIARNKEADRRQDLHVIAEAWLDNALGHLEKQFEQTAVPA